MLAIVLSQKKTRPCVDSECATTISQPHKTQGQGGRPTCFLIFMTLNLSKSFSARLFWSAARFLAQALSSNFSWTLCSCHFFATKPTPVPRGSLGMTIGVRESFASATS